MTALTSRQLTVLCRLREVMCCAEIEHKLAHYRITHDPLHDAEEWADAWLCFDLSRFNLQQARNEYLDAATEGS